MKPDIERLAEKLARVHHAGQYRRDGITPYIRHIEGVVDWLSLHSESVKSTAWLHDIIEDTGQTRESLRWSGIPYQVVDAVWVLTKVSGEDYEKYLARVRDNPIARIVKIADMINNLGDSPSTVQIKKYANGLAFLTDGGK